MGGRVAGRQDVGSGRISYSVHKSRLHWVVVPVLAVVTVFVLTAGLSAAGVASSSTLSPAATTYTVTFDELGLPSGLSWSVTFNGVLSSSTTTAISFTGLDAGDYGWSVTTPLSGTTGVQYVTTTSSGAMSVPDQKSQWIPFEKQYEVSFAASPTTGGSTTPESTTWYYAGTVFVVTALPDTGYSFSSWSSPSSLALSDKSVASTMVTVQGTGTITANFKQLSYTVTFSELGVPSGDTWEIDWNGATSFAAAPSNIVITGQAADDYDWNAAAFSEGTGIDYAAAADAATFYGSMDVPFQTSQVVVYTEQFQVAFADSPSGDGYTTPSSTYYYANGTNLAITATPESGFVFSKWTSSTSSISIESTSSSATNATIRGTGTLTADYKSGKQSCTVCTVTFTEVGLPAATGWSVYWNGSYYASTTSTLTISGQYPGDYYWEATPTVYGGSSGVSYAASPADDDLYLPYSTSQVIVFTEQVWVEFANSPSGASGVSTTPYGGAWYPAGSHLAISAEDGTYWTFSKWSSSTTSVSIAKSTSAATTATLAAPATITATFVQPTTKITFAEFGLPTGTTWGLTFNSVNYVSDTDLLTISGVPTGSWYWTVLSPLSGGSNGVQLVPTLSAAYMTLPTQTYQAVAFQEQFYVTLVSTPSGSGSTTPSGSAWYTNGTIVAFSAINSTGTFKSWSSTSTLIVIASSSSASTTATITGTGIVTAKFS